MSDPTVSLEDLNNNLPLKYNIIGPFLSDASDGTHAANPIVLPSGGGGISVHQLDAELVKSAGSIYNNFSSERVVKVGFWSIIPTDSQQSSVPGLSTSPQLGAEAGRYPWYEGRIDGFGGTSIHASVHPD
jgi:hypothetical protein